MDTKQIPADVLRILIPEDDIIIEDDEDDYARAIAVDAARDQLADRLASLGDEDGPIEDPLLAALAHTQQQLRVAEKDRRLLLAYAREFLPPRRYPSQTLAAYVRMSASNIRKGKAYTDNDIHAVANVLGRFPPGEPADPEIRAMSFIDAMDPAKRVDLFQTSNFDVLKQLLHDRFREVYDDKKACARVVDWASAKYARASESA